MAIHYIFLRLVTKICSEVKKVIPARGFMMKPMTNRHQLTGTVIWSLSKVVCPAEILS